MQAFPAADGRTVYMFTYSDADPSRPSFAELLDTYCRLLPVYQVGGVLDCEPGEAGSCYLRATECTALLVSIRLLHDEPTALLPLYHSPTLFTSTFLGGRRACRWSSCSPRGC